MASRMRMRSWLLEHLPAGVLNRPAEWFLAICCILSGTSIVTGLGRGGSVSRLLYRPIYYGWASCLVIGGLALIIGLTSIRQTSRHEYVIARTAAYLLGLRLLCIASVVYATAILVVGGRMGIVAAAITLAFAGMCAVRILVVGARDE